MIRLEKIFNAQNYFDDQKNFWRSRTGIERTSLPKKKEKKRLEMNLNVLIRGSRHHRFEKESYHKRFNHVYDAS